MVTQCGQILVPSACAAFLIVDFINKHASEARRIRQEFERSVLTCLRESLLSISLTVLCNLWLVN